MVIEVKNCTTCPFLNVQYDDFNVGDCYYITCRLNQSLGNNEYFISSNNSGRIPKKLPEWCPLKKEEEVNIKFNA